MSKLNFKDPAESALVNSKFLGRSVDDETTGKLGLNDPDTATSGDAITNTQLEINKAKPKVLADQDVPSLGELLSDNKAMTQIKRVQGDGAAIVTSSTPFGASPDLQDKTIFYIIGKSDTNTVTIEHNDITDGCLLNGDATLLNGYSLQLIWLADDDRFLELGRNF